MSHRKLKQADRRGKTAGSRPPPGSPLALAKPSARHKTFLAISVVLLAAWLVFLLVLAVLSHSKVKTSAPPDGRSGAESNASARAEQ